MISNCCSFVVLTSSVRKLGNIKILFLLNGCNKRSVLVTFLPMPRKKPRAWVACSRLRVCKHYGFSVDYLDLLFKSLIPSILTYAIEVWGGAFYKKYLSRIDKFLNRAFKLGYTKVCYSVLNILSEKDRQLCEKIKSPDNPRHHLLPPTRDKVLRNRGHSFIIPSIRTERFKSIFINRNLLSFR